MFARGVHQRRWLSGLFVPVLVLLLGSGCGGGGGSQEDSAAEDTTTTGGGEQASQADLDAALEKSFQESAAPVGAINSSTSSTLPLFQTSV